MNIKEKTKPQGKEEWIGWKKRERKEIGRRKKGRKTTRKKNRKEKKIKKWKSKIKMDKKKKNKKRKMRRNRKKRSRQTSNKLFVEKASLLFIYWKTFDKKIQKNLWEKLLKVDVNGYYLQTVKNMYAKVCRVGKCNSGLLYKIKIKNSCGAQKGWNGSSLILALFLNDLK